MGGLAEYSENRVVKSLSFYNRIFLNCVELKGFSELFAVVGIRIRNIVCFHNLGDFPAAFLCRSEHSAQPLGEIVKFVIA